ncbi:uncharacterized protein UV8b_03213 [Ustilaginoidea virens]|uniref:Uncharacterized protein n=1 Tax=Ustilaginoidea virens TaxID=1159556 RepID=A0A8E5HPA1_USTVR|nr:uncharacterized protein UV8b_03213 [Ustilaginoidea virens]QUC18972.1 hypothetical protein UV8b_03213 [Ustilaginoidea virens]
MPRINTALKHVDIHNSWLRQAYQQGLFDLAYIPTNNIVADGLTKALIGQRFTTFRNQLGLVDIEDLVRNTEDDESDTD